LFSGGADECEEALQEVEGDSRPDRDERKSASHRRKRKAQSGQQFVIFRISLRFCL